MKEHRLSESRGTEIEKINNDLDGIRALYCPGGKPGLDVVRIFKVRADQHCATYYFLRGIHPKDTRNMSQDEIKELLKLINHLYYLNNKN